QQREDRAYIDSAAGLSGELVTAVGPLHGRGAEVFAHAPSLNARNVTQPEHAASRPVPIGEVRAQLHFGSGKRRSRLSPRTQPDHRRVLRRVSREESGPDPDDAVYWRSRSKRSSEVP